jgi:vacuolar-type H+-ATPase subunit I/STV1
MALDLVSLLKNGAILGAGAWLGRLAESWFKGRHEIALEREKQKIRAEDEQRETERKIAEEERQATRQTQEKADFRMQQLEVKRDKFLRARLDCMKLQSFDDLASALRRLGEFLHANHEFLSVHENQRLFRVYCTSSTIDSVRKWSAEERAEWLKDLNEELGKAKSPEN